MSKIDFFSIFQLELDKLWYNDHFSLLNFFVSAFWIFWTYWVLKSKKSKMLLQMYGGQGGLSFYVGAKGM